MSLEDGVEDVVVDTDQVVVTTETEVARLAPGWAPAVLHNPVVLSVLSAPANQGHGVVDLPTVRAKVLDHTVAKLTIKELVSSLKKKKTKLTGRIGTRCQKQR